MIAGHHIASAPHKNLQMKDSLGDRMKNSYENRSRISLPLRSYTLLRIDGKAFHTYTKGLVRPFDDGLVNDMDATAAYLCSNIMGAKFAYVQSDEISILMTDFESITTQAWFDNNLQKMVSVSASMATAKFNQLRLIRLAENSKIKYSNDDVLTTTDIRGMKIAEFDSRVFQIPQSTEVENYFIWRQQDATRNSIASVAQSLYSHKVLHGKSSDEQQELIFQAGINWNDFESRKKRGGFIEKAAFVNGVDIRTIRNQEIGLGDMVRTRWVKTDCPVFTQDRSFLSSRIPENK